MGDAAASIACSAFAAAASTSTGAQLEPELIGSEGGATGETAQSSSLLSFWLLLHAYGWLYALLAAKTRLSSVFAQPL